MTSANKNVQEITQKQYDLLIKAQKDFYDKLITDGKVVVVPELSSKKPKLDTPKTPKPKSKPSEVPQPQSQFPIPKFRTYLNPISRLLNKKIRATLDNGTVIEGTLIETSQFEIVIDNTIVLKHAVNSIQTIPELPIPKHDPETQTY